ncbi:hypothetical protein NQ315_014763 [Exocentrus adspersus]|uniref:CCHC-type domain-containing protein n=1 Tax=Exocentrus adspersus TaxID=1586481 RepID=A0AAV8VLN3_9CUCU|nr:hypothetical protein NQ315_014763 [Exocentrus adspersus]
MQYYPNKQNASEFCDKFEDVVRNYENLSGVVPLSEGEKRDAFFNAIMTTVPEVESVEFMTKNSTGKGLSYEQLKLFLMQAEANRNQSASSETRAVMKAQGRDAKERCYECDDNGHIAINCRFRGTGLKKCYECGQVTNHKAVECPVKRIKQSKSERDRAMRQGFNRGRYNRYNNMRSDKFYNDRENRGFKRKTSDERSGDAKRYRSSRGRGNYKNMKWNEKGYKKNQNKQKEKDGDANMTDMKNTKGEMLLNNLLSYCDSDSKNDFNQSTIFTKFLADSGSTEHLTNSKVIFKSVDESDYGKIRCANKDASADLETEGAEMGFSIYLDNKEIDIFDPVSNKSFVTGVYNKPYWIIEFEINTNKNRDEKYTSRRIVANVTKPESDVNYTTRYKMKNEALNETSEKHESAQQNRDEDKQVNNQGDAIELEERKVTENDNANNEDVQLKTNTDNEKKCIYENSNFDTSIWDRTFQDIDELPIVELSNIENNQVSSMNQLLTTLRFYATNTHQMTVGDFMGLHQTTASRIISRVSRAIASLRPLYIKMPANQEVLQTQAKFYRIAHFPRVVGCIDGTHIKIQSPGGEDGEVFRNRKSIFSLNVQVVGGPNLKIQDIVARWPGSTHDAVIFNNSRILGRFENDEFGNGILLGDSGYVLKPFLLTPLLNPVTRAEQLYNESHIRTRNSVERLFGVWKRRFPVLAYGFRCKMDVIMTSIVATAVLHNMAIDMREGLPPPPEEIDHNMLNYLNEQGNVPNHVQNIPMIGAPYNNYRQELINNFFANL